MLDEAERINDGAFELVGLLMRGAAARGEYACVECGYGITIYTALPACPMCGGGSWEHARARPAYAER
jgi:rubrerythrin